MTQDQWLILTILAATVAMFLWGRWRHDMVAAAALLACVVAGVLPATEAFLGFGHPAVITVACVLVLSRGLQTTGVVDALTRTMLPANAGRTLSLFALIGLGALLSGFMNNVGAMALLMPVAIQLAGRLDLTPGQVLMPLAFGTILGGMTTLIGTPPNLIVSGFRSEAGLGSFAMFDFAPIGASVALAGVLLVATFGWRLVPARKQAGIEGFESGAYVTEVHVRAGSKAEGMALHEIEARLDKVGAQIIGLVHNEVRLIAAHPSRHARAGDILMIEADAESLAEVLSSLGLKLEEAVGPELSENENEDEDEDDAAAADVAAPAPQARATARVDGRGGGGNGAGSGSGGGDQDGKREVTGEAKGEAKAEGKGAARASTGEIVLMELAVLPASALRGRSASDILLRTRYGLNLLALSRQGSRSMKRLRSMAIRSGDLLLMQGPPDAIAEFSADNGCVPLAARALRIPDRRKAWQAAAIMTFAVSGAAFGLLPAAVSFAIGVLASMALRTVPPRSVYEAIDWPVVVLLAALIPVAGAMEATGAADLIARLLLEQVAQGHAVIGLALILIVTMFLSDVMNNAATAAVMCPIALGAADALGVSGDAFLMAVAVGASCAFLTPIGHQNNTLILGPGGFRFGDYWKLGLPLEILVVAISIPLLLVVWPL